MHISSFFIALKRDIDNIRKKEIREYIKSLFFSYLIMAISNSSPIIISFITFCIIFYVEGPE